MALLTSPHFRKALSAIFVVALLRSGTPIKAQPPTAGAGAGADGRIPGGAQGSGVQGGHNHNPQVQNNNPYCTPYEWQTNPQECFQRASLYSYRLFENANHDADAFQAPAFNMPPYFDNSYLQNWRANFDGWQQNFQTQLQQNLLQMQQRFKDLEEQIKAQEEMAKKQGGGFGGSWSNGGPGGHHSFHSSSSSFSGDSSGASETVMSSSNNDGSWTIRANGLGVNSASHGNQITISVFIGDADSYDTKIISDKEMLIEVVKRNDPVKRWMSIQITAGALRIQDFQVTRPRADTLIVQSLPLPPPPANNAVGVNAAG